MPDCTATRLFAFSLNNDFSSHRRVHRTEVFVHPGILERKRKLIVGVERFRFEAMIYAYDCVRNVVLVNPGYAPSGWDRQLSGGEAEVINIHVGRCNFAGRGRKALTGDGPQKSEREGSRCDEHPPCFTEPV